MPYNVNQLQKSFMSKITIYHQLCKEEFYIPNWEIKYLFLGTFNPDGGQKVNYYYGRNSNQTWKILSLQKSLRAKRSLIICLLTGSQKSAFDNLGIVKVEFDNIY
jgi:hypothetical protein